MSRLPFVQAFTLATALSAPALAEVPAAVVQDTLAFGQDANSSPQSELSVLEALAHDERVQVRIAAAESFQSNRLEEFTEFEPLLKDLVSDSSPAVRATASATFARNIASMPTIDRGIVLSGWATSSDAPLREASAWALGNRVFVPSSDVMLEHLLDDDEASVRKKAVQAVKLRHADNGGAVADLLQGVLLDESALVRRSARRAVSRAMAV